MTQGYPTRNFGQPTKRYCQTLDLKNDPELIRTYQIYHSESEMWPEILEGFHTIGILEMELYQLEERLFMIVETPPFIVLLDLTFPLLFPLDITLVLSM